MKKKETIQTLINFNKWRRWGEWEQPDPKLIGEAIDNAISTLSSKGTWYVEYEWSYKRKYEDTQAVIDAGVWELRFSNMSNEFLYNALDEIVSMTTDPLTKKVAEMAKERHNIDNLIHARKIFE